MNRSKHAALTPIGRALLISRVRQQGWTVAAAAQAAGVSRRTVYKWLARFDAEGPAGLQDRSSRPHRSPAACSPCEIAAFEEHRRRRLPLWRVAEACGRSLATVARH
ncbi:MAG TPA: leucine zipper domain-containing protein, partial [Ramlibacter sp.]